MKSVEPSKLANLQLLTRLDEIDRKSLEFAEPYRGRWAAYLAWSKTNAKQPLPVREDNAVSWLLERAAGGETDFERRLSIYGLLMGHRLAGELPPPGVLAVRVAHAFRRALREQGNRNPKFIRTVQDLALAATKGSAA
jgi:hypothetical protein